MSVYKVPQYCYKVFVLKSRKSLVYYFFIQLSTESQSIYLSALVSRFQLIEEMLHCAEMACYTLLDNVKAAATITGEHNFC